MAAEYGGQKLQQSISLTACGAPGGPGCGTATTLMYGSYGVAFCALLSLVCCMENARKYPTNLIILGIFTVCESVFLAVVAVQYTAWSVCVAAGVTVVVVAGLTAFACKTSIDFTGMGMYLYASLWVLIIFSCITSFVFVTVGPSMARTMQLAYAGAGCLIFSLYLVYETQMIMGGNHKKFQFTVDDYVFAALNIYLDIINLFIYILSILGDRR